MNIHNYDLHNIQQVLQAVHATPEASPVTSVWLNIHSEKISQTAPPLLEKNAWVQVDINEKINAISIVSPDSADQKEKNVSGVVKTFFTALTQLRKLFAESQSLDHMPSLREVANSSKKDLVLLHYQIAKCFGDKAAAKIAVGDDIKLISESVFSLAQQRLEGVEPITEQEIADIHELLFSSALKEASEFAQRDSYHPAFIFNKLKEAIRNLSTKDAFKEHPIVDSLGKSIGINTCYFLGGDKGQKLWVFKPCVGEQGTTKDTEPACKGITPGTGAKREHLACLLNYRRKYPIPYTAFVKIGDAVGSVQLFQSNTVPLEAVKDVSREHSKAHLVPRDLLQFLSIFDLRFYNTDRHGGNILLEEDLAVAEMPTFKVFGIDHGSCMSSSLEDPLKLAYKVMDQMVLQPYCPECCEFIRGLDSAIDAEIMKAHNIEAEAIKWMEISTEFLKFAIEFSEKCKKEHGVELTPTDITIVLEKAKVHIFEKSKECFQLFLSEVVAWKVQIKTLKESSKLEQGEISRLKRSVVIKASRLPEGRDFWTDLFQAVIDPYCFKLTGVKFTI